MLMFNGKPLPVGVRLLGYTLWSPEMELRTINIPDQRGLMRTGSKIGARSVRLDLVMEADNSWQASQIAAQLRAWCMGAGPGVGKLKLPRLPALYLEAECESYPAIDMARHWESFEATFRCFRPEFISEQENVAEVPADLQISGNVSTPVVMRYTLPSALENPVWTIDAHTIALNGSVNPGVIVIDTNEERAKITNDGEDITSLVTLESDLAIMLEPGTHTFTAPAGISGTVTWRNRYI